MPKNHVTLFFGAHKPECLLIRGVQGRRFMERMGQAEPLMKYICYMFWH
jgi:hypothetical protein